MKNQFAGKLQDGDRVNDYFLAIRKDVRTKQDGGKFLGMVFKDKSGEIGGILWNNAVDTAKTFEPGDVVAVRGQVAAYQGKLQVRVEQVTPLREGEYDMAELVYTAPDAMENVRRFREMLDGIKNPWIQQLVGAFWGEPGFEKQFAAACAAKKWHHEFSGGLARHCYEMGRLAETVCELFPEVDRDVLLAAVFLHDIGKLTEMTHDLFVEYTNEGKLLGHLQIGCDMVRRKMDAIPDFPEKLRLELLHCILSHHGELQNGSPVTPKTIEAIVLHHIDNLDAQTAAFSRIIQETKGRGQEWSEYLTLIDRVIWAK